MFEVVSLGSGSIADVLLSVTGVSVGVGINIVGAARRLRCDLYLSTVITNAVPIQGAGARDLDIGVIAENIGQDGVLVTATNASAISIRPRLSQCNTSNDGTSCGIRVASVSANVDLFDPRVMDSNSLMNYGLFNQNSGSIVTVYGSAVFTGAKDTAVRATGVIAEWPTDAALSGLNGSFTSLGNVRSSQPMQCRLESLSATNVALWSRTLDDESSYKIVAEINGKVSGSSQRKMVRSSILVYRDNGGNATIEGTEQLSEVVASGSFGGNVAWSVSGNTVSLVVNSGGSASYEWSARVHVVNKF